MKITSRERVVTALNHEEPDRVPIAFGGVHDSIHVDAYKELQNHMSIYDEQVEIQDPIQRIVFPSQKFLDRFKSDILPFYSNAPDNHEIEYKEEGDYITFKDEWGTKYRKPKKGGIYFDLAEHVLSDKNIEEVKKHPFPDPLNPGRFKGLRQEAKKDFEETDKAIIAYSPVVGLFENTFWLRGFEQAYMDLASNLKLIEVLLDRLLDWMIKFWEKFLEEVGEFIQIVQIGDDLGGQRGPLFSPEIYRKIFKPRHKKLISTIKENTNAKVYFHSCGSIKNYFPDLIDVGVDIINPVQVSAKNMDTKDLKNEFGEQISFWGGGCDPHSTLANGTPEDVKTEVKKRINDLAPNGGYVFASIHNIQAKVPPENIVAFFDTAINYGVY